MILQTTSEKICSPKVSFNLHTSSYKHKSQLNIKLVFQIHIMATNHKNLVFETLIATDASIMIILRASAGIHLEVEKYYNSSIDSVS